MRERASLAYNFIQLELDIIGKRKIHVASFWQLIDWLGRWKTSASFNLWHSIKRVQKPDESRGISQGKSAREYSRKWKSRIRGLTRKLLRKNFHCAFRRSLSLSPRLVPRSRSPAKPQEKVIKAPLLSAAPRRATWECSFRSSCESRRNAVREQCRMYIRAVRFSARPFGRVCAS